MKSSRFFSESIEKKYFLTSSFFIPSNLSANSSADSISLPDGKEREVVSPFFKTKVKILLDFSEIKNLTFSPVDRSKYPCYDFSIDYIKKGKLYISALSILDEILVNLFLDEKISYVSIPLYLEKF